jgi:dTDP-4-dehydrorhamnose reductase
VHLLCDVQPDVIVNLAGESSVDWVERDPAKYESINVGLPAALAGWCRYNGKRLIQASSQAVFSGKEPPYRASDLRFPVNDYGQQKVRAEKAVLGAGQQVMRLTFILGIRPMPNVGRQNPLEAMIAGQSPQVSDRFFSPLMAWDAAEQIWQEVVNPSEEPLIQVGIPERWSRYAIAKLINPSVEWCHHDDFPGIAPRPMDTTYTRSRWNGQSLVDGIAAAIRLAPERAAKLK